MFIIQKCNTLNPLVISIFVLCLYDACSSSLKQNIIKKYIFYNVYVIYKTYPHVIIESISLYLLDQSALKTTTPMPQSSINWFGLVKIN